VEGHDIHQPLEEHRFFQVADGLKAVVGGCGYTSHPPLLIIAPLSTSHRTPYVSRACKHLMGVHLIDVHLIGVYLTGVHLTDAYLTDVHLMGVYLMSVHLMGMHLTGVHLTGMHLTGVYLMGVHLERY
jgi:hypothetical protein